MKYWLTNCNTLIKREMIIYLDLTKRKKQNLITHWLSTNTWLFYKKTITIENQWKTSDEIRAFIMTFHTRMGIANYSAYSLEKYTFQGLQNCYLWQPPDKSPSSFICKPCLPSGSPSITPSITQQSLSAYKH